MPDLAEVAPEDPVEPSSAAPVDIRAVLNALPAMVGYWDSGLRNRMANDAYFEYFGLSTEEMLGMHISEVLGPELYRSSCPYIEQALAGKAQQFDRTMTTPSGDLRYTQVSYLPDAVGSEVRGFFALVTDVTDRTRAEQEVERSRARLAEAEHVARLGSWEWDIDMDRVVWSDGLLAIYGISRAEFTGRYQPSSKRVLAEDRERLDAEVRRALETRAPIDLHYRIVRPDGRVRHVHARAEVITDPDGRPVRMAGVVQDVTEVQAAAEALHQTAVELRRRATDLHGVSHPASRAKDDFTRVLTSRQLQILGLVGEGLSNAEIADRLFLGQSTVKWHVRKILSALGVANRAQAVARFLGAGG